MARRKHRRKAQAPRPKRERQARRGPPGAPTPERLARDPHEREQNPIDGPEAPRVWRAQDALDLMHRRGSIRREQLAVARKFQADFHMAGLDPLRAQGYERVDGGQGLADRAAAARQRIGRVMDKLGGHGSLLARVCWYVLGAGLNFHECARRLEWSGGSVDRKAVVGVLLAALDLIARGT